VLVVVGVVLAAVLSGSSNGKHPPAPMMDTMSFNGGTTGPLTSVEKKLLPHLDQLMRSNCLGYSHDTWEESTGALRCEDPHGLIAVTYIQFPSWGIMANHFASYAADNAGGPPEGDCFTSDPAVAARRENVGRFKSLDGRAAALADVVCFRTRRNPVFVWSNRGVNVIAEASAPSKRALINFWEFTAGPYTAN
jgi:hypothetical protein